MKKTKDSKSIKIIILLVSGFLLLFSLLYFFRGSLSLPLLGCSYVEDNPNIEWECTSTKGEIADWKIAIFEIRCRSLGGIIHFHPMGWVDRQSVSCVIPFADSGDPCTSSRDCKGGCELKGEIPDFCIQTSNGIKYICEEDIQGECTSIPQSWLMDWIEVDNNSLTRLLLVF